MNLVITVGMVLVYIAGLCYLIFRNPLPSQKFEEYAVGGRSFGWSFITMTIIGTWYPGSLYIGWAQMGVDMGVVNTYLIFYTLGGLLVLYTMATRLWTAGKKYGVKTRGEYFEKRYNSRLLRVFSGLAGFLIELPWIVTEMLAAGYAVQAITYGKVPFNVGMALVAILFTAYILFAGIRAVIIADFYQGWMFLLGGMVLFLVSIKVFFGGLGSLFEEVRMIDQELLRIPGAVAGWGGEAPGPMFWPSLIIMGIAGAYMWPSLFSRIFAASSPKELKASARITPIVAVVFGFTVLWFSVGASARPEFAGEDTAYAMVSLISSLGPVAVAVVGIIILAGSLSMMDSMVSSWSVVVANDLVAPFKKVSSKGMITISRVVAVVLSLGGLLFAMTDLPTIFQIISRMYQGIVQFLPAVLLGLFWTRGNKWSAIGGMGVGFIITGIFAFTAPDFVPALGGMQGGLVGLVANFLVYIVISLASKPSEESIKFVASIAEDDLSAAAEGIN